MQNLEYGRGRRDTVVQSVLVGIPIVAGVLAYCTVATSVAEPFMEFDLGDFSIEVLAPVAVVALWCVWYGVALKRRVVWIVILIVSCWAAITVWAGADTALMYLHEPWRH